MSPLFGRRCRYYPTCSEYAVTAVREYGVARGVILAGWRLLRCNPFTPGGVDHPADQRRAEHGQLADARHVVDLQVVGEDHVAAEDDGVARVVGPERRLQGMVFQNLLAMQADSDATRAFDATVPARRSNLARTSASDSGASGRSMERSATASKSAASASG